MPDPVIERMERHARKRTSVSVVLSDGESLLLQDEIVYRHGLKRGMVVDELLRATLEGEHALVELRLAAERLLARRPWSRKDLHTRLSRISDRADLVARVLDRLGDVGLLDDAAFARAWLADRMRFRPASPMILVRDLCARGVDRNLARTLVADLLPPHQEADAATQLARRYRLSHPSLAPDLLARRCAAFLQRRGFSWPVVRDVLKAEGLELRASMDEEG